VNRAYLAALRGSRIAGVASIGRLNGRSASVRVLGRLIHTSAGGDSFGMRRLGRAEDGGPAARSVFDKIDDQRRVGEALSFKRAPDALGNCRRNPADVPIAVPKRGSVVTRTSTNVPALVSERHSMKGSLTVEVLQGLGAKTGGLLNHWNVFDAPEVLMLAGGGFVSSWTDHVTVVGARMIRVGHSKAEGSTRLQHLVDEAESLKGVAKCQVFEDVLSQNVLKALVCKGALPRRAVPKIKFLLTIG